MQIPGASQRAFERLHDSSTPLYQYIVDKLGGNAIKPLGEGIATLTNELARLLQGLGRRGYLDVTMYEAPRGKKNKYIPQGALNFTGAYPRHLLTAEGVRHFYGAKGIKR